MGQQQAAVLVMCCQRAPPTQQQQPGQAAMCRRRAWQGQQQQAWTMAMCWRMAPPVQQHAPQHRMLVAAGRCVLHVCMGGCSSGMLNLLCLTDRHIHTAHHCHSHPIFLQAVAKVGPKPLQPLNMTEVRVGPGLEGGGLVCTQCDVIAMFCKLACNACVQAELALAHIGGRSKRQRKQAS